MATIKSVKEITDEIREHVRNTSSRSSAKDEVKVAQSMLNDKDYKIQYYSEEKKFMENTEGPKGFCKEVQPSTTMRNLCGRIISSATKIKEEEANKLMSDFQFKKSDAEAMVDLSKAFVNTYLETERKLPLGGRETSNVILQKRHYESRPRKIWLPINGAKDENGKDKLNTKIIQIPAYDGVSVKSKCPLWVKIEAEKK